MRRPTPISDNFEHAHEVLNSLRTFPLTLVRLWQFQEVEKRGSLYHSYTWEPKQFDLEGVLLLIWCIRHQNVFQVIYGLAASEPQTAGRLTHQNAAFFLLLEGPVMIIFGKLQTLN